MTVAMREALAAEPGVTRSQHRVNLDKGGLVPMKPDLVHLRRGRPVLVVDAKYKAERADGFPNGDAYQMLAYCTALQLARGHLVYAKGLEQERTYDVLLSDVVIHAHALDLGGTPVELLERVQQLVARLLADVPPHGSGTSPSVEPR